MTDAVDLFAGLGGLTDAAESCGIAVKWAGNHWPAAVEAHAKNHPNTEHSCADLLQQDWSEVPSHDLMLAAPSCQGHSPARGKDQPRHDSARATAWAVVMCAEVHRPRVIVVENVVPFTKWVLYQAWCAALNALGYTLAPHVVDAADYGVAQNRQRLILIGTRSRHPFKLKPRRVTQPPFSPLIEWNKGEWRRIDRHLALATRNRISNGRRDFGERFLMPYYGNGSGLTGRSIDRPIGTITTKDRWAIVNGDRMRMLSVSECRAAQSFRKSCWLPANIQLAKHMLGNAVPPKLGKGILSEIYA